MDGDLTQYSCWVRFFLVHRTPSVCIIMVCLDLFVLCRRPQHVHQRKSFSHLMSDFRDWDWQQTKLAVRKQGCKRFHVAVNILWTTLNNKGSAGYCNQMGALPALLPFWFAFFSWIMVEATTLARHAMLWLALSILSVCACACVRGCVHEQYNKMTGL